MRAAHPVIDSLKQVLSTTEEEEHKVQVLLNIAWNYRNSSPDIAIQYAEKGLELARKSNQNQAISKALNFIGVGHYKLGNYLKTLSYYEQAKKEAIRYNNKKQEAYAYYNMGRVFWEQQQAKKALNLYYQALKIFEQLDDTQGIAYCYNSFSTIYQKQNNYEQAIDYAQKTLKLRKTLNDKRGEGVALNQLAEIYLLQGQLEKALEYLFRSLQIYEKLGDFEGLALSHLNIGRVHFTNEKYTKTIYHGKKSFKYYNAIGNKGNVARSFLLISKACWKEKEYSRALRYGNQALNFAKTNDRLQVELEANLLLFKIYEKKGKYQAALKHHQAYAQIKDKFYNKNIRKQEGWLKENLEVFKKDQENQLLKEKEAEHEATIQKQEFQKFVLIGGIFIVFIFILLLARINHQRNKDLIELVNKNQQIEQQKETLNQRSIALTMAKKQLQENNEQLEQKVVKRTLALKKSNEELELYANLASHDLKQPLRSITSFAQLLARRLKRQNLLDDTTNEYIKFIVDGTQYMNYLLNELLIFSKFQSTSNDDGIETIECVQLIEIVKKNLHQQMEESNANIVVLNLPKEIIGIKIKCIQLFQNLISNAIKFRKKEDAAVICIDAFETETHWQFSIADNGIGIEQEYFDIIFQSFKKLHSKQEYAGIGLGLATCKKIVEQHQGEIWLESEFGKGTTFHFSLIKQY